MAKRVLVVDDEPLILKGLRFALEQDGYDVDTAEDGQVAASQILAEQYDIVLLDAMLPRLSGLEVIQRVRGEGVGVPIIMITAKGEDMDKILGLEYGADDYMTKPFNILEVKARIKSILRRASAKEAPARETVLTAPGLVLDTASHGVMIDDAPVNLTVKEYELLYLFLRNRGRVYTREQLLETIWGPEYAGDDRTVDVHIRRLREKIEKDPAKPQYIQTKWGVGYYFADR